MLKVGMPPYLECSSKGDKRFSAFYAKVNGRSIEEQYQAAKIFEDGTTRLHWKEAKGRNPVNREEVVELYDNLWRTYLDENPHLRRVLLARTGLSDMFGSANSVCQAEVLWRVRCRLCDGTLFMYGDESIGPCPCTLYVRMYGYWLHQESGCGGIYHNQYDRDLILMEPLCESCTFAQYKQCKAEGYDLEWTENEEL